MPSINQHSRAGLEEVKASQNVSYLCIPGRDKVQHNVREERQISTAVADPSQRENKCCFCCHDAGSSCLPTSVVKHQFDLST